MEFQGYSIFKIIKLFFIEMQYKFCPDRNDNLLVTFNYKVISCSESRGRFNILNFQERQCQKQIKVLIDQKLYDNGLEKLIKNVPEEA